MPTSRSTLICTKFSLERVHKAGAIVNKDKLDWFHSQHFRLKCENDLPALTKQLTPLLINVLPHLIIGDDFVVKVIHVLKVVPQFLLNAKGLKFASSIALPGWTILPRALWPY